MAVLFAAIGALLLFDVTICASDPSFCNDQETQVKTRWIFDQGVTCSAKISEIPDFYNEVYRYECQWWQDLSSPPEKISNAFITECFALANGTTKYKAKVCCPGAVTRQRCFTCNSTVWEHDNQLAEWHSDNCNHFVARPAVCNSGEVCQTTLGFNKPNTVSKFCAPKSSCLAMSANNDKICKTGKFDPSCTYCCEGSFCNYETKRKWLYRTPNNTKPCICYYNGEQVVKQASLCLCKCQPGTWGPNCQNWMNYYEPCKNNAIIRRTSTKPYYHCYCRTGYKGVNCTEHYPTCNEQPAHCLNGGTCFNQGTFGRRCRCANGFVGTHCEIKTSSVCGHGAKYYKLYGEAIDLNTIKTCTQKNEMISIQYPWQLGYCNTLMNAKFHEGINGHVSHVESTSMQNCERGDEATWTSLAICCPACLGSPCQNSGWCIQGRDDYVCQCRFGYEGKNCEHKVVACYVSGDPHYRTFDGLMLHYQGVCRYNLASPKQNYPALPYFRVLAKSERRQGNMHVSYTRYVDVEVFGHVVRLDKGKKVYMDGVSVQVDAIYPGFEITNNGRFVRLATNFSLIVESDGEWLIIVKAPPSFAGKMAGLCGDADGDTENDWRMSNGNDVKSLPNAYSLIGNSWLVEDKEDVICPSSNETNPPECNQTELAIVSTKTFCGLLDETNGIFQNCIRTAPDLAAASLKNCQFDVCTNLENTASAKAAACGSLAVFSDQCKNRGLGQVNWRTVAGCPLPCESGMVYRLSAAACHPTCTRPNAPEECGLPMTESCVCADKDDVVVDGKCVKAQLCGCTDVNGEHREIGAIWMTEDCSTEKQCVVCESCTRPVGKITSRQTSCEVGERCSLVNGVAVCKKPVSCEPGMVYQLSAPACRPTCLNPNAPEKCEQPRREGCVCADINAVVVDGKCVNAESCGCTDDNGVHREIGDHWMTKDCSIEQQCVVCESCARPVGTITSHQTSCEAGERCFNVKGVALCQKHVTMCYVSGDPHYRTFDGLVLHYQGVCRHNLASPKQNYPALPFFRVLAKNEHRYGNEVVSYVSYVDVEVFGHIVRLNKGKKIYVDDAPVQVDATYPGFEITHSGVFVRLTTNFSLVVESDGVSVLKISAPQELHGKMAGLCGDADGDMENDWRMSNGTDVKGLPNAYSLIGNSWQVEDKEEMGCVPATTTNPHKCTIDEVAQVSSNALCGLLEDVNGIFKDCIMAMPELAASSLGNCQFDVCANMPDSTLAKASSCASLHAFSVQCSDAGFGPVDWRDSAGCPLACEPGMVYSYSAPACRPTCRKPNAPEVCEQPRREGCVCADKTAVVVDGKCVNAESCGCTDYNGVHRKIFDSWMNDDCTTTYRCTVCNTCIRPVGKIVYFSGGCPAGQECSTAYGNPHCEIVVHWSGWTAWGDCTGSCGQGTQTRTRICTDHRNSQIGEATCLGPAAEGRLCICETTFSAAVDCKKCNMTSNYIGYAADPCDCSHYYQCQLAEGKWIATRMPCASCLHWDPAVLTCVKPKNTMCEDVTEVVVTGHPCNLRPVDSDVTKYIAPAPGHEQIMSCPSGTVFSLSQCTCVLGQSLHTTTPQTWTTTAVTQMPDEITCVNFDDGWNGFGGTNGVYVQAIKVNRVPAAFIMTAAKFDGSGHLEVPRFSNSYASFKQFAVSFCYMRNGSGGTAAQGLITNGNCVTTASISITSGHEVIAARLTTDSGTVTVSGIKATDDVWHHVVLTYDGSQVHLCVDGTCHFMGTGKGSINERHCPMVIGRLAASGTGFNGLMDELCFYDAALPEGAIKKLQDKYFPGTV